MNMEEEYECPFEFQELSEEEKKISAWFQTDLVKVRPTRTCAPRLIKKFGKELYNFKPRPDDIWLIGFPRSGTTLTQEILYLLGTDLDYEKAAGTIMDIRFPVLCFAMYKNQEDMEGIQHVCNDEVPIHKQLEAVEGRRFIKSHYGFSFIHPKILDIGCKVVFIARNPKDVMVSRFYYPTYLNRPGHTFEKLWHIFKNDLLDTGNYFEMLNDAWQRRHNKIYYFCFMKKLKLIKKRLF
ncbi:hypothetical protein HHI36_013981 [Cryptolaemus montrouzieri]|uniref:Sulfotransferase domain-containing protein n=1 Tax=Cryptolaemus montrouzieri TaxID=559131 RepID=A0ABD2N191_9CUCU